MVLLTNGTITTISPDIEWRSVNPPPSEFNVAVFGAAAAPT